MTCDQNFIYCYNSYTVMSDIISGKKLQYMNSHLFYSILYKRLFKVINILIDHNDYNINYVNNHVKDFIDSYSYYLLKDELVESEEQENEDILIKLKSFEDEQFKEINKYPTKEYKDLRYTYLKNNSVLSDLSTSNYYSFVNEYYRYFDDVITVIQHFITVSSESGFLPNIKSKKSLKTIGFANFDFFFNELENLKVKVSDITAKIDSNNFFKSRRCMYCFLLVFTSYYQQIDTYKQLKESLDFSFINDKEVLKKLQLSQQYEALDLMPKSLREYVEDNLINDLKTNISIIKRYLSYEFGELGLSPSKKKKYGYIPRGII